MGAELPTIGVGRWWLARIILAPPLFYIRRFRVTGKEHIPKDGALLVVTNHLCDRDPPIAGIAVFPRRLFYFAKAELFKNPLAGWFFRGVGAFPVQRGEADREAFRSARGILKRGDALLFFPEGTRSKNGKLGPPFPGAGSLGLDPDVTILPIGIWGSQDGIFKARAAIGPSVSVDDLTEGSRSERAQLAVERIMESLADLIVEAGGPAQEDLQ